MHWGQLICVLALLQDYQAAMTEDQMYKLLDTVYEIKHTQVGFYSHQPFEQPVKLQIMPSISSPHTRQCVPDKHDMCHS